MRFLVKILIVSFLFASCHNKKTQADTKIKLDSLQREDLKITFIRDTAQIRFVTNDFTDLWTPTWSQLDEIDSICKIGIQDNQKDDYRFLNVDSFSDYYRQLIFYTNSRGDSLVFVNSSWRIDFNPTPDDKGNYRFDWQNELIHALDGGDFYWQILINFTKKKYIAFNVNGEA